MGKNEVVKQEQNELSNSEKFSTYVIKEYGSQVSNAGELSHYKQKLIQGYYVGISKALENQEIARISKNSTNKDKSYNNDLPVIWQNVDMQQLAIDVRNFSDLELDMMQPNHLNAIPIKDKKKNKYVVRFIKGYAGIQYLSLRYAIEKPKNVIVELIYTNDVFKAIKKNRENNIESYDFEIVNAFDRGEIIGGFGYLEYDDPKKNKLIIMTRKDMDKRKPKYASAEFWGGKVKEWKNGKQVEVDSDGWLEEMLMKTLKREVYSPKNIELDPRKIDDSYNYVNQLDSSYANQDRLEEIEENANTEEFIIEEPIPDKELEKTETVENNEIIEQADVEGWQKES